MSTPMPGYVFQCHAPPTPSPSSMRRKSSIPARVSATAAPMPENPAPTMATSTMSATSSRVAGFRALAGVRLHDGLDQQLAAVLGPVAALEAATERTVEDQLTA